MTLWLLLFVAILSMVGLTFIFLLTTKKAYAHKHTIDTVPQKSYADEQS
ncbi:MAG: YtzI protein [Paenisporosarcina sp.]